MNETKISKYKEQVDSYQTIKKVGTNIPDQPAIPSMPTLVTIKSCKYLLPCGLCEKSDKVCNQYPL